MDEMSLEEGFRVLELAPSASQAEAWTAFLRLARRNHPELHPRGQQNRRFGEIVRAYQVVQGELDLRAQRSGRAVAAGTTYALTAHRPQRNWSAIGEAVLRWWARGMLIGGAGFLLYVVGMILQQCFVLSFPQEGLRTVDPWMIPGQDDLPF